MSCRRESFILFFLESILKWSQALRDCFSALHAIASPLLVFIFFPSLNLALK